MEKKSMGQIFGWRLPKVSSWVAAFNMVYVHFFGAESKTTEAESLNDSPPLVNSAILAVQ